MTNLSEVFYTCGVPIVLGTALLLWPSAAIEPGVTGGPADGRARRHRYRQRAGLILLFCGLCLFVLQATKERRSDLAEAVIKPLGGPREVSPEPSIHGVIGVGVTQLPHLAT
jgi:hypothetical protein